MFIALEGIDCSGKTEVARRLAAHIGAEPYATPPKRFLATRERIDATASPEAHYCFYRDSVLQASEDIWELLAEGKDVVCDRYWLTTYVYHRVMGLNVNPADFDEVVKPDLTALLMVSPDVQAQRFLVRGLSAGDYRMLNKQEALAREYKRAIAHFKGRAVAIDTDHLAPAEVVKQIIAEVNLL